MKLRYYSFLFLVMCLLLQLIFFIPEDYSECVTSCAGCDSMQELHGGLMGDVFQVTLFINILTLLIVLWFILFKWSFKNGG